MKLGVGIGYSGAQMSVPLEMIQHAESLGYDSVWSAEAYGSDALTPLAYIAARTEKIKLATGILQIPARTPAMTAMSMGTLDALAGGDRVICGLGLSGPQVVEGWYGRPWGKPGTRIREYVQILRAIFKREEPVSIDGVEYQMPYTGEGAMGLGKPLKSILHMNPNIPIYLATLGPGNVRLTAEIADGWLPMWYSPYQMHNYTPWLDEGFEKAKAAGEDKGWHNFSIQTGCTVIITDDVQDALRMQKPNVALYVGGMGARDKNFHNDTMVRYGYGEAAARIQDLYLSGQKAEALEEVPDELVGEMCLVGPVERIRERYKAWADSGLTAITVNARQPEALELMAELAETKS